MCHKFRKDPVHKRLLDPDETAISLVAVYNTNNSAEDPPGVDESAEITAPNRHPVQFNILYQPLQRTVLTGIRFCSGSETPSTWTNTPVFAIPNSTRSHTVVYAVNRFANFAAIFTEVGWPAILSGATFYGAANFRLHPNSHYNDAAGWRLLGFSNNFSPDHGAALLANMSNGDIPAWASFWTSVITAGALGSAALGYAVYHTFTRQHLLTPGNIVRDETGEIIAIRDTYSLSIRDCLHELEYNGHLSDVQKKHYLNTLLSKAQDANKAIRLNALMALAQLAQHPDQTLAHVKGAREFIWQQQLACPIANMVSYFYNLHQNPMTQMAFNALRVVFHFYSKAQLWRLFIYKLMQWRDFETTAQQCKNQAGVWQYSEVAGNYRCHVTGAGYAYERYNHRGQSALTQLLRYQRTPSQLITEITQIAKHGPLSEFDFSQQAWAHWCLADLEKVFSTIAQHVDLSKVNTLILGSTKPVEVSSEQAYILSSFIAGTNVTEVVIANLQFATQDLVTLAQALPEHMTALTLDNIAQADVLLSTLTPDQVSDLQQLTVSGYEISLATLKKILPYAYKLTALDLSDTQLAPAAIDFIHQQCASSPWQSLSLSGNDLSVSNMSAAADCLMMNQNLTRVDYAKTRLSDFNMQAIGPAVCNSSVTRLDVNENIFSSDGAAMLLACARAEVAIGDNFRIDDQLCESLPAMIPLTGLSIAGTRISGKGLTCILNASHGRLWALNVSATAISAQDLMASFAAMIAANQALPTLDLSMLDLPASVLPELAQQLFFLNVTKLNIAGNPLQDNVSDLARLIHPQGLTELNMTATEATDPAMVALIERLPGSALQVLIANANPHVTSQILTTLASTLIPGVPAADLGHANIDRQRMINYQPEASNLTAVYFEAMPVAAGDANALCQSLPATQLQHLQLGNQTLSTDIAGCPSNFGGYPLAVPQAPCSVTVTQTQRARFFSPVASVPSLSSQLASTAGSAFMGTLAVEQLKSLQEQYFPNNRAAEMLLSMLQFAPMALLPAPELLFVLGGLALAIVLKRQSMPEKNHAQLNDALIQTIALCVSHLPHFLQAPAMPLLLLIAANVVGSQAARSISGREQNHAPHFVSPQP